MVNNMYEFVEDIDKKEYEDFVLNSNKSHFMQSYYFGQIQKSKEFIPHYVGLRKGKKLVASALVLEKKILNNIGYMYCPRGFILDYSDKKLITTFCNYLKEYTKKNHDIFFRMDPDLEIDKYAYVIDELQRNGFKHKGFNKNFEHNQPRYTFRLDIDKNIKDVYASFHPTTRKILNKGNQYNLNMYKGDIKDIDAFYTTMVETGIREHISPCKKSYYEEFYKIFNNHNMSDIYVLKVNINELKDTYNNLISDIKSQIEKLENVQNKNVSKSQNLIKDLQNKLSKLNKELVEINDINEKELVLSSIITAKYKDMVWTVHGGNHNKLRWLNANYLLYYEIIKDANESGYKVIDFFGTTGAPTQDNPIYGIHLFKQRLGGELKEFIGEFDYVNNKLLYFLYNKYLKIRYKKQN